MKHLMCVAAICLIALAGCNTFERNAFNTLSASKAVIDQAQADYTARTIPQTACSYAVINSAKAAQTVGVNAMLVYEQEKTAGQSLTAQEAVITAELAALPGIVVQVKTLYTNPGSCTMPAAPVVAPPAMAPPAK